MKESPRDTIAAVSTPVGSGAIAIVRMSGERALEIADAIFEGVSLADAPTHTVHYGRVVDSDGRTVDEVLATVMRAPRTYTTEDMVEFGCHGGSVPAGQVLGAALCAGARIARRGEFTERAFLSGRLDLVQAEAVADIVAARTRKGLEVALGQLSGSLSAELEELRDALIEFRAEVEALVDVEEDYELSGPTVERIAALGDAARERVAKLLERCDLGAAVREGVSVAIVGKPNVGKSSLMNALLERDRAIVTSLPGTTRDAIEDDLHVCGIALRLIDTAGWRDGQDEAERAGVERAKAAAAGAGVVVLVLDGTRPVSYEDRAIAATLDARRTLVAVNKTDLGCALDCEELSRTVLNGQPGAVLPVSALEGTGLPRLREALFSVVAGGEPCEGLSVTNVRHAHALRQCGDLVAAATARVRAGGEPELAAVDLSEASEALGAVTGETTPEDVIERIFERFCVGK